MASTFSSLKIELIGTGEQSGLWGVTTNNNLGVAIEQALVGMATLDAADFTANVCTLTLTNTNAAQDARALCLNIASGAVSAAGTVNVPAIQKPYIVINGSSFAVTVKVSGQTGVAVPAGTRTVVYNNGTDVGAQITYLTALALGSALPVASGGTGQTTYTDGQLLIGNSTGNTLTKATLTAGSGITITNGAGAITIAASGGGGGTVTSVAGAGTVNGLTLTGTVTTTGSLTLGGTFRYNIQVVGVNTAATANNVYVLTAGSITITLPATPTAGDIVGFSNMSGATNIVVARNGSNIMALAQDLTIDQDGAGFLLVYADATRGWVLMP
jgi:hypothetical protein